MQDIKKTVAFQITDQEFLDAYEKRVQQSGLKVKDYLMGLIRADISQASQINAAAPGQAAAETALAQAEPQEAVQPEAMPDAVPEEAPAQDAGAADQPEASQPEQSTDAAPDQDDGETPAQGPEVPPPAPNVEMTNLFVKIPKELREDLNERKNETGENVGDFLNRVIKGFMTGDHPDGLDDAYDFSHCYIVEEVLREIVLNTASKNFTRSVPSIQQAGNKFK